MQENYSQQDQTKEKNIIPISKMTEKNINFEAKEKVRIYVMWRIHNKKYQVGTRLFFNDVAEKLGVAKQPYSMALEFLEGANLVVNEVVIADKVPSHFVQRYDLRND
ncbi:hypothetical protein BN424_2356 [Carnobacterium maltaromaticum LMA28]|uniref:Uncharacterized protein n=1 Tax=Carnobacterium maltaromaticum LMA28 TaxID=1234679 RepID=K8ET79_CARML|nr:hypothetical protein [Carnobacterium maltaromaticum]AOA04030.1 hypothetical protein BFC23_16920 [Carnobacterium maltaromaticum]KRN88130.1 hypothetical protein IV75_GL002015 [Carnobacterium maltaromaticum]MBC9810546.1 hypothetical protein [Carnobacterium maltaromaticum]CCO11796.2 hypothetical protein BN424_2356 [Carnobacterium maltaromaticum LMA28]